MSGSARTDVHFASATRFFGSSPRYYHVSLTLLDMRVTSEMRQRAKANKHEKSSVTFHALCLEQNERKEDEEGGRVLMVDSMRNSVITLDCEGPS